eukprot:Gregarina_sp_Poly_1__1986@NODE_151_length_12545_cov_99_072047_g134_i0_p11_GENE_NODE_151_length_12545_cov_99_072047_g134_i0NODE_151_length_12545_cov_99_072047_g134_i0_p11_ORF_typecomplete_len101_score10_11DUF2464/PF10240_9/0_15_NODE_151_length_12545_cov_99_072047_g134_i094659767
MLHDGAKPRNLLSLVKAEISHMYPAGKWRHSVATDFTSNAPPKRLDGFLCVAKISEAPTEASLTLGNSMKESTTSYLCIGVLRIAITELPCRKKTGQNRS